MSRVETDGSLSAAAFESAAAAAVQIFEDDYAVCGTVVRLRFAGPVLRRILAPALAHLAIPPAPRVDLTVSLWDAQSTDGRQHFLRESRDRVKEGEIWLQKSPERIVAKRPSEAIAYQLDVKEREAFYWLPDATAVPFDERVAPLRHILSWWLREHGWLVVHSAAVAAGGAGLLFGGSNNAGKSTTALSCLHAGLGFGGDNYIALRGGEQPLASSLFASASLRTLHANAYPELLAPFDPCSDAQAGKVSGYLHAAKPASMIVEVPIVAIAVPMIAEGRSSSFRALPKSKALLAFISNAITPLLGKDPDALAFLADLVRRTPSFQLEVGLDFPSIPAAVRSLLAQVSGSQDSTSP